MTSIIMLEDCMQEFGVHIHSFCIPAYNIPPFHTFVLVLAKYIWGEVCHIGKSNQI